jgi:Predicted permeases
MEFVHLLLIAIVGILCGFINIMAGSGSLISLPALMAVGLSPHVANATNRVGILLQNIVGTASFSKQKVLPFKQGLLLAIPTSAGSIAGAYFAVDASASLIRWTIVGLLVCMFFMVIYSPDKWLKPKPDVPVNIRLRDYLIFTVVGFYGGFIQAGIGYFLLASFVLSLGNDLITANALKVFLVLILTIFALAIFFYNGQVNIPVGICLGLGNMVGGWLGAKYAVRWGAKIVRFFLLGMLIFSIAYMVLTLL